MKILKTLVLLSLIIFAGSCNDDEEKPQATITIKDNVSTIQFESKDTNPKTLTFNASDAWEINLEEGSWLSVSPAMGEAGDHTVTFSLKDGLSETERMDKATIKSLETEKSITIKQLATIALREIEILAPQTKVMPTGTIQLTAVNKANQEKVDEELKWSSSNPEAATINENGLVTAVAEGKAIIGVKCGKIVATLPIEVTEEFMTDGRGKSYTMEDLAKLSTSGVTYENNIAQIVERVTISANDTIVLGNTEKIVMNEKMRLTVEGVMDFTPEKRIVVETIEGATRNSEFYFTGDVNGGGKLSNIDFNAVYFRVFGPEPLTIEDCTFSNVTERKAVISLGTQAVTTVKNCKFKDNAYPAITSGANFPSPVTFVGNELINNSIIARKRPPVNLTVGGDGEIIIKDNTIKGPSKITTNGGIYINNFMGNKGVNKVTIEGNNVSGWRFGIAVMGRMNATIKDNILTDNKYEEKPDEGGEAISVTGVDERTNVKISGNKMTGHLWGVTIVCTKEGQGPKVNLGSLEEDADYNPGKNIFKDNGHDGKLYDLYNGSASQIFAQGNYWNVEKQDKASIEEVIYHKNDNPKSGEVIFMPAGE